MSWRRIHGDVISESLNKERDQTPAMLVLFAGHIGKDFRTVRIVAAQALREIEVDAAILFFAADSEGQKLARIKL